MRCSILFCLPADHVERVLQQLSSSASLQALVPVWLQLGRLYDVIAQCLLVVSLHPNYTNASLAAAISSGSSAASCTHKPKEDLWNLSIPWSACVQIYAFPVLSTVFVVGHGWCAKAWSCCSHILDWLHALVDVDMALCCTQYSILCSVFLFWCLRMCINLLILAIRLGQGRTFISRSKEHYQREHCPLQPGGAEIMVSLLSRTAALCQCKLCRIIESSCVGWCLLQDTWKCVIAFVFTPTCEGYADSTQGMLWFSKVNRFEQTSHSMVCIANASKSRKYGLVKFHYSGA